MKKLSKKKLVIFTPFASGKDFDLTMSVHSVAKLTKMTYRLLMSLKAKKLGACLKKFLKHFNAKMINLSRVALAMLTKVSKNGR